MAKTPNGPKNDTAFTCLFKVEKETKGTYKYQQIKADGSTYSIDGGAQIGSLYIRKSAFGEGSAPTRISIVVTRAEL
jgi:hypothetical protein